ncbi:MAG: response regulator [Candidatus Omnitrophica bacterium]|nr:response regulator [Candidatus Omnitrophota bacterium]MDD5653568.1 response regulator [Candidatus Omnitrophota bacterium]
MSKRVLVVDDEEIMLKVVSYRLKSLGYQILTAVNGKQGLEMIKAEKPDLVILDVRLPLMDGREVCRAVKTEDGLKHIPVILLTASSEDIAQKAKECCADDYSLKPFDPADLTAKIKKLIGE